MLNKIYDINNLVLSHSTVRKRQRMTTAIRKKSLITEDDDDDETGIDLCPVSYIFNLLTLLLLERSGSMEECLTQD